MYNFYYDESEHSRIINYNTISAGNYYDNFVSVIVGWPKEKEKAIFDKYLLFETKYADRKDKSGELKSKTLSQNEFEFGFASLNKHNVQFIDDFLSIFDEDIKFYFSVTSKIEYLVLQLFSEFENNCYIDEYNNSIYIDARAMKYSITKALVMYRPDEVIKGIYDSPSSFVDILKKFLQQRIECNKKNIKLKEHESRAFEEIINYLEKVSATPELKWNYYIPFEGFRKYLEEENIINYALTLDKEGEVDQESKTLQTARKIGLNNTTEANSLSSCGLRMADMMAGIITKLLKSLCNSTRYHTLEEGTQKKILDTKWFEMNERQLSLYKKLHKIICIWDKSWYKSCSSIYSDDLIAFISLLNFMNHFETAREIRDKDFNKQGEYFNGFVCKQLSYYFDSEINKLQLLDCFDRIENKFPIQPIVDSNKEFFLNNQGAKVYFDIKNQPVFSINKNTQITVTILSVGVGKMGIPLATILNNGETICYRLPQELSNWAYTITGMSKIGGNLFPQRVTFSNINGNFYVDIL